MGGGELEHPRCGNCGAQLAPNPLAPAVVCGYCGTEYATAAKPRRDASAMADVASIKHRRGARSAVARRGTLKEALWTAIFLYLGVVFLGWLVSRIPSGGAVFLVLIAVAAGVVAAGKLFTSAPGPIVRGSRLVFENLTDAITLAILLVCSGVVAVVYWRVDLEEAHEEAVEQATEQRLAAEQSAAQHAVNQAAQAAIARQIDDLAAQFPENEPRLEALLASARRQIKRGDPAGARQSIATATSHIEPLTRSSIARTPRVEALRVALSERIAELDRLERETYSRYFRELWSSRKLPASLDALDARVGRRMGVGKQSAVAVYLARQGGPVPDERPVPGKRPRWAAARRFSERCGEPPVDPLSPIAARTKLAQPGDKLRCSGAAGLRCELIDANSVVFDPVSCAAPVADRKRCWTVTCVWRGTDDARRRTLHKWRYAFAKGTYTGHEVLFPK
ncbi:MAG: hypothetical protein JRI55_31350 [Deltaproteobacteria bacterium]|jgi:hypothetical protein|nr:hypothetical protein [Deltaproteobacteria bacterium]